MDPLGGRGGSGSQCSGWIWAKPNRKAGHGEWHFLDTHISERKELECQLPDSPQFNASLWNAWQESKHWRGHVWSRGETGFSKTTQAWPTSGGLDFQTTRRLHSGCRLQVSYPCPVRNHFGAVDVLGQEIPSLPLVSGSLMFSYDSSLFLNTLWNWISVINSIQKQIKTHDAALAG